MRYMARAQVVVILDLDHTILASFSLKDLKMLLEACE
jgi:hypothetical protein